MYIIVSCFILQTGFVETLKPQFTPGIVLMSPNVQTQRPTQTTFIDPVEHEGLKVQVQDLTEKLEAIKSMKFYFSFIYIVSY